MALPVVNIHLVMEEDYSKYDESMSPHKNCPVCHPKSPEIKKVKRKYDSPMTNATRSKTKLSHLESRINPNLTEPKLPKKKLFKRKKSSR